MHIQNISISKTFLLFFACAISGLNVNAAENPSNETAEYESCLSTKANQILDGLSCKAELVLGNIRQGDSPTLAEVTSVKKAVLSCSDYPGVNPFYISSGTITVEGDMMRGKVLEGAALDANALEILKKSAGKQVTVLVSYTDQAKNEARIALVFTVQA